MNIRRVNLYLGSFILLTSALLNGSLLAVEKSAASQQTRKIDKEKSFKEAEIDTMVKCLGREEAFIHENRADGPLYALNQKLVNLFAINSDLEIKKEAISKICTSKEFTPSVNLLKHLILEGKNLFVVKETVRTFKEQKIQLIEVFLSEIPTIFFQYLADLQQILPQAGCISNQIPEISQILLEQQYIEEEPDSLKQIFNKARIEKIFNQIKGFDNLVKKCVKKVDLKKTSQVTK